MKITSLTLQAFRGFNRKEEFCLDSVDVIVLYGPNGHGKSSVYDAIEWGLTGGIHRFNESSPERKRARFIRNLHADNEDRSFVKIGIILSDKRRFFIERECTATVSDRTDYEKYRLKIFDKDDQLYKENNEAETALRSWLIHEEWLPGINAPTTMLSLTHILSQEKIADFLRGMQERDRYDAISTIFGTDYFDKYREGFRIVRNELIGELDGLKNQVSAKKTIKSKLLDEVNKQEEKVVENENIDFHSELENYEILYPEIKVYKDDMGKLLKFSISNQKSIRIEEQGLQREYHLLKEIEEELPNLIYTRKVHKAILNEQKQLQMFKGLSLSILKIEQLISMEKIINDDSKSFETLISLQKDSNIKLNSLTAKREKLLRVIESINIELSTSSWQNGLGFLAELKSMITEEDYAYLNAGFLSMLQEHEFIEQKKVLQQGQLIQLRAIDESIKQIESADEVYSAFLSSLNQYILVVPGELNNCPACGTEEIKKGDILSNVQKQQSRVNKELPKLKSLNLQIQSGLKEIDLGIKSAKARIVDSKESVNEVLSQYKNDLKKIDITASTEQQNQITLQQKIDLLKLKLNQFEEDCALLGFKIQDNIKGKLELKHQELLKEIRSVKLLGLESSHLLPEKLRLKEYNRSKIDEHEQDFKREVSIQEAEINRIYHLIELSKIINVDPKTADLDKLGIKIKGEIEKLDQRLKKLATIEDKNINLQSMIELNTEKMRLIQLQKELDTIQKQVKMLETQEEKMNQDSVYLRELINKSTEAVSNLNEEVFSSLKETIQIIFEQINSHPVFTRLDLVLDKRYNNNCLTISVSKVNGAEEIEANAQYVFSSAQVNSIALSLFLAMSLKQKWSPLELIGMDDPIQNMDEINIVSFIDLMRLLVEKHKKQIIISTHDHSFYNMILKKFRYHNLKTIEYKAYSDKGPSITINDESTYSNKVEKDLSYRKAEEALLQLDRKESY